MHPHLLSAIAHILEALFIIALIVWIAEHRKKIADMAKDYEERHISLTALICRIENAYHKDIEVIRNALPEVEAAFASEAKKLVNVGVNTKEKVIQYGSAIWAVANKEYELAATIINKINNKTAMQKQIQIVGTPGDPIFYVDNGTAKQANIAEVHLAFDQVGTTDPVITHNYVTDVQTAPMQVSAKGDIPAQYLTLPVEQVFTTEADATASIAPKTLTAEQITEIEAYIKTTYGVDVTNIS